MIVHNGDINYDYFCMNSSTGSESKNYDFIDYTEKRDEISTKIYLRGNNGLTDVVDIDDMLPASEIN